jgi:hypothetical protein
MIAIALSFLDIVLLLRMGLPYEATH